MTARKFVKYTHAPLIPPNDRYSYEAPTSDRLWHELERLRSDAAFGRSIFAGSRGERTQLWHEIAALVEQGRVYYEAASHVQGASAALLYYYAFLQLAKAELLLYAPTMMSGVDPHHGLSFRPSTGSGLSTDRPSVVRPTTAVFPLLYEKRTGRKLKAGERLPVARLLGNVPETAWEAEQAGLIPHSNVSGIAHVVVRDNEHVWSKVLLDSPDVVAENRETRRLFLTHFRATDLDADWRAVFAYGRRVRVGGAAVYESRQARRAAMSLEYGITNLDLADLVSETWDALGGLLDYSDHPDDDALLAGSLYKSRCLFMPTSLARYALMFYVSSLARYAPGRFNAEQFGRDAWILDGFVMRAATALLQNAVGGILGLHFFGGGGMRA